MRKPTFRRQVKLRQEPQAAHQQARLNGQVVDLEHAHHALDPVAAKDAKHVVLQTEEIPGAAGIPLPAHAQDIDI